MATQPLVINNSFWTQSRIALLLRLSLGIVFFWFGVLKLANVSPVVDMLNKTYPIFAVSPYLEILGVGEILIAVGLAIDRLHKQAAALMVLHLMGTLTVAFVSPQLFFAPSFPILTMEGEFVVKNFVLIVAALAIIYRK